MSDQTPPPNPAARPERESLAGITFRPAHDSDAGALVALWEACGLTRPWNDPRKDIGFARDGAASDVLVGVEGDVIIAAQFITSRWTPRDKARGLAALSWQRRRIG